jgi:large subunit ribosomal protein L25
MLHLAAKIRDIFGRATDQKRKEGLVPAIVYGPKIKNLPLFVDLKEFKEVFSKAGESSLIALKIEGKKELPVLVHEIQKDPTSSKIVHIDFYSPDLKKKVKTWVPLAIRGVSEALKLGGILVKNISEIEVKALPIDLPHEISVNIESLKKIGDEVLVRDLPIPNGVEVLRKPDEVVVSVLPPQREKIEEELEKPVEKEMKEPERVSEEKEERKEEKEQGKEEQKEKEKSS